MGEKIVDAIVEWWPLELIIFILALMLIVPFWAMSRAERDGSLYINGYRPRENGERVVCIYNHGALYCSAD